MVNLSALSAVILAKAGIQTVNSVECVLKAPQIAWFARQQLCGESVVSSGLRLINGHLSTLCTFGAVAHIEWVFQEKDARSSEAEKRIPDSGDMHTAGSKFDFTTLKNPDASIRATVAG